MTGKTKHINSDNQPSFNTPLPPNLQRFWEELQRKHYLEKYALIDFVPETAADNYWRWGIKTYHYKSILPTKNKDWLIFFDQEKESFVGNIDLQTIFQANYKPSNLLWSKIETAIKSNSFFVPKGEIARLGKDDLQGYLLYLQSLTKTFPFAELMKKMKTKKREQGMSEIPLPLIAIWEYFQLYAKFIKELRKQQPKEFKVIAKVLAKTISIAKFKEKLPSEQIWTLLQGEFQVEYFNGMTRLEQQTLVQKARPKVRTFWKKYFHSLEFILENGYSAVAKRSMGNRKMIYTGKETASAFYNLFKEELEWVKIQEIIDPYFENKYTPFPLEKVRFRYRINREKDVVKNIEKAIGDKSIIDRIKESEVNHV